MTTTSMQVKDYMHQYVRGEHRAAFRRLMIDWDGSTTVMGAFYMMDILSMKHREAREI